MEDQIPIEYLGICASHVSKTYLIPAIFLKKKNDIIACEGRCTKGFDLIEAFSYCKKDLIQYGGHKQAAGFTIEESKVHDFMICFKSYVELHKDQIKSNRKLLIDAVIENTQIDELEQFFYTDYQFFQPYGEENPSPLILLQNYQTGDNNNTCELIKFREELEPDNKYDLVLQMNNSYIKVLDYKLSKWRRNEN